MFIDKDEIEDFDKCAVGDILYKDLKDKKFMYRVYSRHNRTVRKLKSRPVMPDSLIAEIKEDGLEVQSINIYDDSRYSTMSYGSQNWPYPQSNTTTTGGGTFTTSSTSGNVWHNFKSTFRKTKP